ncbi:MAG TPA: GIY-YIG nuclease family protein [Saprospiraceae bacterium]|nr:GIY-YIG nuclease family protein [Saprospiraceae bacterium]HPI05955.1 GIY-YIG nuclease family protein [Saprospiraceae bacterium]
MTKKELTEEYKNMKIRMGVFQIRNTTNGKIYVEGSPNLDKIWNRHKAELNFGTHLNENLQKDWKEFGEESFKFEILGEIDQDGPPGADYRRQIKQMEEIFLEELEPFDRKGYNRKRNR